MDLGLKRFGRATVRLFVKGLPEEETTLPTQPPPCEPPTLPTSEPPNPQEIVINLPEGVEELPPNPTAAEAQVRTFLAKAKGNGLQQLMSLFEGLEFIPDPQQRLKAALISLTKTSGITLEDIIVEIQERLQLLQSGLQGTSQVLNSQADTLATAKAQESTGLDQLITKKKAEILKLQGEIEEAQNKKKAISKELEEVGKKHHAMLRDLGKECEQKTTEFTALQKQLEQLGQKTPKLEQII